MRKYWIMKTFKEWSKIFQENHFIGIDQKGLDKDYEDFSGQEINALIKDEQLSVGLT